MKSIQIYLPLTDNAGEKFDPTMFAAVEDELAEKFGGVTAYSRAPARGIWRGEGGRSTDDIVVFEVFADTCDSEWWANYRQRLELTFKQEKLVVTVQDVEFL